MKQCTKCGISKALDRFYLRKRGPRSGKYYERCKDCMKSRGRKYYHNNRDRQLSLALARRREARLLKRKFIDNLKDRPCADCGESYPPYVMDFDHKIEESKISEIAYMTTRNWSIEKIRKEIEKCDIVCANCHRIRTHERRVAELAKVVTAGA